MNFEHDLDTFVREVVQNSLDARLSDQRPLLVEIGVDLLTGEDKARFLAAAHWPGLREHLHASIPLARSLDEAIARIEDAELPFPILSIHDGPACGLSGKETGSGRFAMFARNKLLSEKGRTDAAGSFGLGKAMLWAHSGIATVLVHSEPQDCTDFDGTARMIGVAHLPWHQLADAEFDGPGWLGIAGDPNDVGKREWSRSFPPGEAHLEALHLNRPADFGTGTSIVVPDFLFDEETPEDCAQVLADAVAKWFWPAMTGPSPILQVRVRCGPKTAVVNPANQPNLKPFLHLAQLAVEPTWIGHSVTVDQGLTTPAVRDAFADSDSFIYHPKRVIDGAIRLDAMQIEESSSSLTKTMAMMRGAGMIVEYASFKSDQPTFILARAGTALGDTDDHRIVEQFLRHAEPPSHTAWTPSAPKLHDHYKSGYKGELRGLKKRLVNAALVQLRDDSRDRSQQEIPAALQRIFNVSWGRGRGSQERAGSFNYDVVDANLMSQPRVGWEVRGRARCSRDGRWFLVAKAWLDCDGSRIDVAIEDLRVSNTDAVVSSRGILIPNPGEVNFSCFCPIDDLGPQARQAVFAMELKRRAVPLNWTDNSTGDQP